MQHVGQKHGAQQLLPESVGQLPRLDLAACRMWHYQITTMQPVRLCNPKTIDPPVDQCTSLIFGRVQRTNVSVMDAVSTIENTVVIGGSMTQTRGEDLPT